MGQEKKSVMRPAVMMEPVMADEIDDPELAAAIAASLEMMELD